MNIVGDMLVLFFLGATFCGLAVTIFACIKKRWKLAVGTVSALVAGFSCIIFLLVLGDPYLRKPVAVESVAGTYFLDLHSSQSRLRKMGYGNFEGEITLNPEGTFAATQIPACCIHGWDETTYPFSGGYYTMSGTWQVANQSDVYVVRLQLSTAQISDQPPKQARAVFQESRAAPQSLDVHLMKGRSLRLGFSIFNGDFDDILFAKGRK